MYQRDNDGEWDEGCFELEYFDFRDSKLAFSFAKRFSEPKRFFGLGKKRVSKEEVRKYVDLINGINEIDELREIYVEEKRKKRIKQPRIRKRKLTPEQIEKIAQDLYIKAKKGTIETKKGTNNRLEKDLVLID